MVARAAGSRANLGVLHFQPALVVFHEGANLVGLIK
jgi:hypothetical protein